MHDSSNVISFACPKCGNKIENDLGSLQANPLFACDGCLAFLQFNDEEFARLKPGERIGGKGNLVVTVVS